MVNDGLKRRPKASGFAEKRRFLPVDFSARKNTLYNPDSKRAAAMKAPPESSGEEVNRVDRN